MEGVHEACHVLVYWRLCYLVFQELPVLVEQALRPAST